MLFVCYFLDELRFSRIFSQLGDMKVDFRFKSDAPKKKKSSHYVNLNG